jgi:hypothetical protein
MEAGGMIWVDRESLLTADLRFEMPPGLQKAKPGLAEIGSREVWTLQVRPDIRSGDPAFSTIHL